MRERKPALFQLRPELGESRRGDEQDEGRRHHVVNEARRGDLFGADAAADAIVALQHQHLVALAAQAGRRHQRVDAASDDDVVGRRHSCVLSVSVGFVLYFFGTIASTRNGLPVPLTILSGAAIRIAPFGGSLSRWQRLARP